MDKLDIQEKLLGGIFGVISIAAAVAETIAGGIDAAAIFGMVKDISGTLVVVVVMLAVAKMLAPKKYKKSFEDRLNAALDEWVESNSSMVIKGDKNSEDPAKNDREYRLSIRTELNEFFMPTAKSTPGVFLKMPLIKKENYRKGAVICFETKKSLLYPKKIDEALWNQMHENTNGKIAAYLNQRFTEFATAAAVSGKKIISVTLQKDICSDEDIAQLITLINAMYTAYLVSSDPKE